MINELQAAYHARLAATPAVAGQLGQIAGEAAIFSVTPVPPDSPLPYVVIREPVTAPTFRTKTTDGQDVTVDIAIYDVREEGPTRCNAIADAVRDAIDGKPLAVVGYGNLVASANGPIGAPADNLHGRVVIARTVLMRKS